MGVASTIILFTVIFSILLQCKATCSSQFPVIPGSPGRDGLQGPSGPKGDKGDPGDAGSNGRDGIQGVPGRIGDKGDRGDSGGEKGEKGDVGDKGDKGDTGFVGLKGDIGLPGPQGEKGEAGSHAPVTLNTTDYNNIVNDVMDQVNGRLDKLLLQNFFNTAKNSLAKCGIPSANWRRIAYFDTTNGDSCPSGLRTVTNDDNGQTACGRTSDSCTSVTFATSGNYSNVCGRVRGYQFASTDGFGHDLSDNPIDSAYMDGISFTYGSPRTHLWSYVSGWSEDIVGSTHIRCPCARPDPNSLVNVPNYVQSNYYCESGRTLKDNADETNVTHWEDPLWDGSGCVTPGNTCCEKYGWFHREISSTFDDVEVRWCGEEARSNDDVFTDQLEIWVM